MLMHAFYGNYKDLFARVMPSHPKTFVVTLKKISVILTDERPEIVLVNIGKG